MHDGMKYPYLSPPLRSFYTVLPYFAQDRAMARLLTFEGQTDAAHGNWAGAMNAYLDGIEIGGDLPHGSGLIGDLTGIACASIARLHAGVAIDHLTAPQARAAADRLAAIEANAVPVDRTLQEQEYYVQAGLLEIFRKSHWKQEFGQMSGGGPDRSIPALQIVALRLESPKTAFDNYTHCMNAVVAHAKLSWPAQRSSAPPPMPADPINRILWPMFGSLAPRVYASAALNRLLETQLALYAYRLDHGRYPGRLDQLVPNYLPSLPLDPFTDAKPLQYRISANYYLTEGIGTNEERYKVEHEARLSGDHYVLYSVGPDAVDDGGRPVYDAKPLTNQLSVWSGDSKGDIVAGVNH
jgi:hypothetical protein